MMKNRRKTFWTLFEKWQELYIDWYYIADEMMKNNLYDEDGLLLDICVYS